MSMSNLTIDGEFRYIVQWFNEWSELQRDDFVPILVNYITDKVDNDGNDEELAAITTATTPVNMNGLQNDFVLNGKPMSLFQCRIKLFNQWNRKWPIDFKEKLQQKITEIDVSVGDKIKAALNPNNGVLTNGFGDSNESSNLEEVHLGENVNNQEVVPANDTAVQVLMTLTDPMTEVLNNETSVDDIETNEDVNNSSRMGQQVNNIVTITAQHVQDNNGDEDVVHDDGGDGDNDDDGGNNENEDYKNTRPVEQVVQMQNLQINEDDEDHEDVTATVEQQQQQQHQQQPVTVTVNPVVVTQTITTNAEVPLVA